MPRLQEFSPLQITNMHYYYGLCRGSARAACIAYLEQYPNSNPRPAARHFQEVHRRLCQVGLGNNARDRREQRTIIDVAIEEAVLRDLFADPTTSLRRLALRHGISKTSVWKILKKEGLHPFHYQRVQGLNLGDTRPRCVISTWILREIRRDPDFTKRILWMDEARFTHTGITNFRNLHTWAYDNPHLVRQSNFQDQFVINVWAGLIDDKLIGPVILPQTLNADTFLHLLREVLPELLADAMEDVPIAIRRNTFLQMDGCPAHWARIVRNFLNENYPNRWIGRDGPVGWPARSPDMTPLDYFLWGTLKQRVYQTVVNSEAELYDRIMLHTQQIKNNAAMIRRATQQIQVRATYCLQQRGAHFEQLIPYRERPVQD